MNPDSDNENGVLLNKTQTVTGFNKRHLFYGVALVIFGLLIGIISVSYFKKGTLLSETKREITKDRYQSKAPSYIPPSPQITDSYPTSFVSKQKIKPKSKQEIIWETFNFTTQNKKAAFSIQFPDVGEFCEGCFDSWSTLGANNFKGDWIKGSYFQDDLDGKWSLTVGVLFQDVTQDTKTETGKYDPNMPKMVDLMLHLKIGEKAKVPDPNLPGLMEVQRLPDKQLANGTWSYYMTTDSKPSYFALLQQGNKVIILSYWFNDPVYDVFDNILQSFSGSLVENPDYGESLKAFNTRTATN